MEDYKKSYAQWASTDMEECNQEEVVCLARRLTHLAPQESDAWDALGRSLMGVLFPGHALADTEDGQAAGMRGEALFEEMVSAFDRAAALLPVDTSALWNGAGVLSRVGDYPRAHERYRLAAMIDAADPDKVREGQVAMEHFLSAEAAFKASMLREASDELSSARSTLDSSDPDCLLEEWVSALEQELSALEPANPKNP
jgi:tetratricopeptide (TPR) repeat protein